MGWMTQDDNDDAAVKVKFGYDRDTKQDITEFIVADKQTGEEQHIGTSVDTGETVFHNAPK